VSICCSREASIAWGAHRWSWSGALQHCALQAATGSGLHAAPTPNCGGGCIAAAAAGAAASAAAAGVTDNDKIKVQLYVDVCYFTKKLRNEIYHDDSAVLPETVISLEQAVASAAATLVPDVSTSTS